MERRPIVCGRQLRIVGDAEDMYFQNLENGGVFADNVIELLSRTVADDWVTIDVGANLGLTSIALAILSPKGSVHAFEPVPRTAQHLCRNVEANGARNVEVHAVAVGAQTTELQFLDNTEFAAGSFALDSASPLLRHYLSGTRPAEAFIKVPCTTLDEFVRGRALERLDLVKVDAEGFDLDVIDGGADTLARFKPCVIMEFAAYALTMHRSTLPQDALAKIRAIFDRVFVVGSTGGVLREIVTEVDACDLVYDNVTQHPVQDLLCGFTGSPSLEAALAGELVGRRLAGLERQVAELRDRVRVLTAENDRFESSMSWRVTAPLRQLRRLRSIAKP